MWFWILYIVGIILWYLYVKAYYSEDGTKAETEKLDNAELIVLFVPVVNILFSIVGWIFYYPYLSSSKATERKHNRLKKFFNIKD